MESQPQNPEFRNDPENFHTCILAALLSLNGHLIHFYIQVCDEQTVVSSQTHTGFNQLLELLSIVGTHDSFVCFDSLRPRQQFFSHVGMGLPRLNQY